jgi:hypothetical protein
LLHLDGVHRPVVLGVGVEQVALLTGGGKQRALLDDRRRPFQSGADEVGQVGPLLVGFGVHRIGAVQQTGVTCRPEPQRAPGVHDGPQPPVRCVHRVEQVGAYLLLAHRVFGLV